MNKLPYYLGWLFLVMLMTGCKSEYNSYVEREMNTGLVNDSLIFGMRMGQTKKEFFTQCWELNRQKLISQGTGNTTARYTEPIDSTKDETLRKDLLFYGIFDEENIMRGMDMTYHYLSWSPWLVSRHSDKLAIDLKQSIMKDYGGNDFIEIEIDDTPYTAFVKIDGNRQILIYPINNKDVKVKIEDLNYRLNKDQKKVRQANKEI